jgi:tripartite-type tricarboxylate transporter receptor subunit TctC
VKISPTRAVVAACIAAVTLTALPAAAQTYPSKPVRLIVPFAGADLVAWLLAAKLSPALGEQVITDPRFGAGGNIAAEFLKSVTKIDVLYVPYKSATIGLAGATAGEVDVVIVVAPSAAPFVKQGRIRTLALLETKRVSLMPYVPTSAEAGTPQVVTSNW